MFSGCECTVNSYPLIYQVGMLHIYIYGELGDSFYYFKINKQINPFAIEFKVLQLSFIVSSFEFVYKVICSLNALLVGFKSYIR